MNYTNYIPLGAALVDVYDVADKNFVEEGTLERWASKAMSKIYAAESYQEYVKFVCVENYKAILPRGVVSLYQVLYKGDIQTADVESISVFIDECPGCGISKSAVYEFLQSGYTISWTPATPSTSPFTVALHCENSPAMVCDTHVKYNLNTDGTITVNMETGYLAIAYLGYPTTEEGEFMIPDDEMILDAIKSYCMYRIWEARFNTGEEGSEFRMQHYLVQWEIHSAKARGEQKTLSVPEWENFKNQMMRLGPHSNTFWTGFGNLAQGESLRFDNKKYYS
jgi:hypothetical protein